MTGSAALPRLAYLDNGPTQDTVSGLDEVFRSSGLQVDRFWAFDGAFPESPNDYDGILLSGSPLSAYDDLPFIHLEHAYIRSLADAGTPVLGLCFGSQILASALCGKDQVFRRQRCEVGYVGLEATAAAAHDRLMRDTAAVRMLVWHNDEVRGDHKDMVVLASTSECPNHIWRYRELPMWGIQGHPEVTRANAPAWIGRARDSLLKDGADPDALIATAEDSPGGMTMVSNFIEVCRERSAQK